MVRGGAPESFGESLVEKSIAKPAEAKNAVSASPDTVKTGIKAEMASLLADVIDGKEADKIAAKLKEGGPDALTPKQQAEITAARGADTTETIDYDTAQGVIQIAEAEVEAQFGPGFATQMAAMEAYADLS